MKTLVLGSCSVDTLIHVDSINSIEDDMSLWANKVFESIGGTGAGKAFSLDVLGNDVTFLTDLGEDENSAKIVSFFNTTNVTLLPVKTDKSTAHTNIMHSRGKRITIFTSFGTQKPEIHPDIEKQIEQTDVVFLNINGFCRDYIPILKKYNKPIIVDIHDYNPPNPYHEDFIQAADIIIASGVYIDHHEAFLEKMIHQGKKIAIITKGSDGLIAMDSHKNVYHVKGYNKFEYIDSNGAGDSFCSGFITEYYKSKNIGESLKIGTLCGAMACTSEELYNRNFTYKQIKELKKTVEFF